MPGTITRARRALGFARWIDRRRWPILIFSMVLAVAAGGVASRLPIHGDFSYLLPPDAPSVLALHALEKRVSNLGTLMAIVRSDDPEKRARAAAGLRDRLAALGPELIAALRFDDGVAREFIWQNRFLYADLTDLSKALDGLRDAVQRAKLQANPLYVDFDDEPAPASASNGANDLQAKLDEAKSARAAKGFVSKDGTLQLLVVRTPFEAGAAAKSGELVAGARRAVAATLAEVGPGVEIGLTGDVVVALEEHDALLAGMLRAVILTSALVAFALLFYYRSARAVAALLWALAVGTAVTFAFTKLAIGHLNVASAFLSSIVVGNGINFGILVVARHLEEKRRGLSGVPALAAAIGNTVTGTLAAALTATVAYGSLLATEFKGFRHFGLIGGVGMVACWVAAYTVLPAALAVLERRRLRVAPEPGLGAVLARLVPTGPRRVKAVVAAALTVTVAGGVATAHYLKNPYEDDFGNLRSTTAGVEEAQKWLERSDASFGRAITGGFVIAAPTRAAARSVHAELVALDRGKDADHQLLGSLRSIDDLLPGEQTEKLAVLGELRALIDHEAKHLAPADRARLDELRPPDALRAITEDDLPTDMAWPFTEKDGTRGRILLADTAARFDTWRAHDLQAFTESFTRLDLGPDVIVGGAMFVFADVTRSLQADGPKSTAIALVGAVLIIAGLVGLGRYGAIVLLCMGSGLVLMLTGAWLLGLRVNFLDFVALPITIGIGIDYAVNIVVRSRQDGGGSPKRALATTGGAVALCSFTTVVGYGSLILSANQGIRSFGLAAILGELTCIAAALFLAPALLQLVVGGRRAPLAQPATPIVPLQHTAYEPRQLDTDRAA